MRPHQLLCSCQHTGQLLSLPPPPPPHPPSQPQPFPLPLGLHIPCCVIACSMICAATRIVLCLSHLLPVVCLCSCLTAAEPALESHPMGFIKGLLQVIQQYQMCLQNPIIAQGYEECGGYDAACLVSMTDDPEADPEADLMSFNIILAFQGMMSAASRCGHLPAHTCTSGWVPCICALELVS